MGPLDADVSEPRCVQVDLKHLGFLVTGCVRMKELFTQEDVTSVLSQLINRQPLPPLIMRTLINVWQVHTDSRRCAVAANLFCSHGLHMLASTTIRP